MAVRARSTGSLPMAYAVEPLHLGELAAGAAPCCVSAARVDGTPTDRDAL